jgi:hypothetical protein
MVCGICQSKWSVSVQESCEPISGTRNIHIFPHSHYLGLFEHCVKMCACVMICVHINAIPCSAIVVQSALHVFTQHMK